MKNFLLCPALALLFFLYPMTVYSQARFQTIRGQVVDAVTRDPLPFATVAIQDLDTDMGTFTEEDGSFILEEIPLGRHILVGSFVGYEPVAEVIELTAAKEVYIEFLLPTRALGLSEVVVTSSNMSINPLATVSARAISPEETQYYPASANDIGRSALSLPGVQPSKDNESDIIVRGNSSAGLLWRLEGVDILNPNHFARKGGSGGGITMFSLSLMDKSDFFTSAFPAEYGNALSGVFDLRFRKGNNLEREHTFRAGMIGLDLASEGPFKKEGASYLFNYRYSTLGLLNKMDLHLVGERVENNFQDLSFSLFFPGRNKKSSLKIWGVGGLSIEEKALEDMEKWQVFSDSAATESGSDMGVIGATYSLQAEKSFFNVTVAGMAQRSYFSEDVFSTNNTLTRTREQDYLQGRLSLAASYSKRTGAGSYVKTGVQAAELFYDLQYDTIAETGGFQKRVDGKGNAVLLQPYVQWQWSPKQNWTFNLGLHAMYFSLTQSFLPEPRVGINYLINKDQSLSFGYGLHGRYVPLGSYFTVVENDRPNLELDLMKTHHFVLSYERRFGESYRLLGELYYQYLFDIPAGTDAPQTYWVLNDIEGFSTEALVSGGNGKNYGFDLLFEKSFRKNLFFLISASVFNTVFTPLNHETYNTQFNSHFSTSCTVAKEWSLSPSTILQVGAKALYNPGVPATPIVNQYSTDTKPVYDETNPFSERVQVYFRTDTRVAFRKNAKDLSWIIALDIQNVTNRRNLRPFGWRFEVDEMAWERSTQASLIPLLSFQIDF